MLNCECTYVNLKNNDMLDCAFIIAGGEHNKQIREFAFSNGYIVSDQAGIDDGESIFTRLSQEHEII